MTIELIHTVAGINEEGERVWLDSRPAYTVVMKAQDDSLVIEAKGVRYTIDAEAALYAYDSAGGSMP